MTSRILWFALGFVVAAFLSLLSTTTEAQRPQRAFISNSGLMVPLAVDSSGNVKIQIN